MAFSLEFLASCATIFEGRGLVLDFLFGGQWALRGTVVGGGVGIWGPFNDHLVQDTKSWRRLEKQNHKSDNVTVVQIGDGKGALPHWRSSVLRACGVRQVTLGNDPWMSQGLQEKDRSLRGA